MSNPFSTSTIELSFGALQANIAWIKSLMGEKVLFSSVVKGNAYGHGISSYVPLAMDAGIRHFSVFSAEEAWEVHQVTGNQAEILIMGSIDESAISWCISNEIGMFVFDQQRLQQVLTLAQQAGKPAHVHLEIETGMNRTGFMHHELSALFDIMKKQGEWLLPAGICTHFAGAESMSNHFRVKAQIACFEAVVKMASDMGLTFEKVHAACSAAALLFPESRYNMVRIGILQYGLWPSPETRLRFLGPEGNNQTDYDPLQRVIQWTSRIMSVQQVAAGEFVGYGTHYLAHSQQQIAMIPVGYSHGYARSLSNQGRVLIHGRPAPVVGIVNMSLMMADVSHIPEAKSGDEVILIGKKAAEQLTVASFGELSNQLNYELLTRIPHNIPRLAGP